MRRLATLLALACVAALAAAAPASAGPVILGGDDLTSHGQQDGAGNNEEGWLYMEKAIGNLKPNVTRPNDNSIAALGSAPADPATEPSDAGAAIRAAADKNGMTVRYFNGADEINNAFASIRNGSYRPAIVWVAGDDADNDLSDTGCQGPGTEGEAITNNAQTINTFVDEGGGLMSHGTCYTWLTALLPTVTAVQSGSSDDLYLTPEGQAAFPGLANTDINAGPWHNHFEGDFGGLQVLARSTSTDDSTGTDAAVILGGSAVSIVKPPSVACSNAILGDAKSNDLTGTAAGDLLKGLQGNDTLNGLGGDDCVRGGPGSDKVQGGDGNDQLFGGQKPDKIGGGAGNDLIKVRAGRADVVSCGPGNDTVRAGENDLIRKNCEKITN